MKMRFQFKEKNMNKKLKDVKISKLDRLDSVQDRNTVAIIALISNLKTNGFITEKTSNIIISDIMQISSSH